MNIERWNHAIAIMRATPADAIDLWQWRCGTKACMGGHFAADPEFKRQGLNGDMAGGAPLFGVHCHPFNSLAEFFDIPWDHVVWIFDQSAEDGTGDDGEQQPTGEQCARFLEHYRDTGEIEYDILSAPTD